ASPTNGAVVCDLGSIAAGASATITVVVTPTVPGNLTDTACASLGVGNTCPVGSTATATATTTAFYTAYVANSNANFTSAGSFNTVTGAAVPLAIAAGGITSAVVVTPNGRTAYIAANSKNTVTVANLTTSPPTVVTTISGFSTPVAMAVSPNG